MKPYRIQLSRKKGWRLPPNTVVVSRPSRWGNPHKVGWCELCNRTHTREEAIQEHRSAVFFSRVLTESLFAELRGKNLACWCRLDQPCHADVLLEIANR